MRSRAFTLLEVMVSVAILGLALTVILSAQAGLYAAHSHAAKETIAIGMARCKMGEIEEDLLRMGYQELDVLDEGDCCEDQTPKGVRCSWKIERVELPDPPSFEEENPAGDENLDLSTPSSALPGGAGPLGALLAAGKNDAGAIKAAGGPDGGFQALSSMMGESAAGGVAGIAPLVMSIVYPSLKPMLEASIRKVTVMVEWKEGQNDRDLTVVQYVTNPMRGGFSQTVDEVDPTDPAVEGLAAPDTGSMKSKKPSTNRISTPKSPSVPRLTR
ncbi:MAG: general secretion pathway protein GspI [Sorangium cellulosum]|nr:MAG: general secretion pathway protein GspI [Sorangium cellulosum]